MCGRYSFAVSKEKIETHFGPVEVGNNLRSNFNIAPTQHAFVMANDSPTRLQFITWGLIPYWSKGGENKGKLINARIEGIEAKPSFRLPLRQRRCLVLADSYYAWRNVNGEKIPYRVMPKNGELMIMAGIWDMWMKGDYGVKSFSILTTPPNTEVDQISTRMPLIFGSISDQKKWLSDISLAEIKKMLATTTAPPLKVYRISEKINSIKNNSPELHLAVKDPLTLVN